MEGYNKAAKELEEERAKKLEEAKTNYLAVVKNINNTYSQALDSLKEKYKSSTESIEKKKDIVPVTYLTQSIADPVNTSRFNLIYGKVKSNQIKIERNGTILL